MIGGSVIGAGKKGAGGLMKFISVLILFLFVLVVGALGGFIAEAAVDYVVDDGMVALGGELASAGMICALLFYIGAVFKAGLAD